MKKSNLEIIALGIGLLVLLATAFLMFSGALNGAASMFYTNIAIAVGFLVYIGYNWLTTNSLNKEIRNLSKHVESLKEELKRKDKRISTLEGEKNILESEKVGLQTQLQESQQSIEQLNKALEKAKAEAKTPPPSED
jgi:septal ring factor EnvC (AmiA/AmiB activator)